jgi:hypothetical protein
MVDQMVNNNNRKTQMVTIMAQKHSPDDIWNDIFDSLVLDNEPPFEYIKNVVITTKTGVRLRVSAVDFAQILERERFLTSAESDILSCKLAINFDKVRKDVDKWADQIMYHFENNGKFKPAAKKQQKRKPVKAEVTAVVEEVAPVIVKPVRKSAKAKATAEVATIAPVSPIAPVAAPTKRKASKPNIEEAAPVKKSTAKKPGSASKKS